MSTTQEIQVLKLMAEGQMDAAIDLGLQIGMDPAELHTHCCYYLMQRFCPLGLQKLQEAMEK